jgi:hypothetical protein
MNETRKRTVCGKGQSRASYQGSLRQTCSELGWAEGSAVFFTFAAKAPAGNLGLQRHLSSQKPASKSGTLRRNAFSRLCFGEVEGRAEPAQRCGCV